MTSHKVSTWPIRIRRFSVASINGFIHKSCVVEDDRGDSAFLLALSAVDRSSGGQ